MSWCEVYLGNLQERSKEFVSRFSARIRLCSSRIARIDFYVLLVLISILLYGLVFSYFTILKHNVFQSYAWDLGIFDQAMYSTLHGQFLHYTVDSFLNPSGCFFAQHISPLLLVILPLYAVHASATTLLVIKSFALAFGALPLYLLARTELNNKRIGFLFALLYLLYPALQASNWFDFQPQAFLPLLLFSSYYFFRVDKWKLYFFSTILALMVEEHISIIVFVISAFMFINDWRMLLPALKNRRLNRALVSVVVMVICMVWFISAVYAKGSFPINEQFIARYKATDTFSVLGVKGDPLLLPIYVLTSPQNVWNALMYDYVIKFFYIVLLFAPLLFLPFKNKLVVGVFMLLAPFLLSNYWPYYTMGAHYPLYILPAIFLAALNGLKKFHLQAQMAMLKTALLVTVLFVASTSPISPISSSFGAAKGRILWYPDMNFSPNVHTDTLHTLLQLIPPESSVLTQNHLFPHVSNRLNAYVIPPIGHFENDTEYLQGLIVKSDYVLLDLYGWDSLTETTYHLITKDSSFGSYALGINSVLMKKGYQGEPLFKEYIEEKVYVAHRDLLVSGNATVVSDSSVETGVSVFCPQNKSGVVTYGPFTYLIPSTYEVTFAIKVGDHDDGYIGTIGISEDFGNSVLSRKDIYGFELQPQKWTNFTLRLASTELRRNVEYRMYSSGFANVHIDKVYFRRVSPVAVSDFGSWTLSPSSVYSTLGNLLRSDTGNLTKENFLVHYHNLTDDVFWFGPYWTLAEGNYTATFFVKVSSSLQVESEKIVALQVSAEAGIKSIAKYQLYFSDFNDGNDTSIWHAFTIEFTVKTPLKQVEFRGLEPSPNHDIYLAFISIEKTS